MKRGISGISITESNPEEIFYQRYTKPLLKAFYESRKNDIKNQYNWMKNTGAVQLFDQNNTSLTDPYGSLSVYYADKSKIPSSYGHTEIVGMRDVLNQYITNQRNQEGLPYDKTLPNSINNIRRPSSPIPGEINDEEIKQFQEQDQDAVSILKRLKNNANIYKNFLRSKGVKVEMLSDREACQNSIMGGHCSDFINDILPDGSIYRFFTKKDTAKEKLPGIHGKLKELFNDSTNHLNFADFLSDQGLSKINNKIQTATNNSKNYDKVINAGDRNKRSRIDHTIPNTTPTASNLNTLPTLGNILSNNLNTSIPSNNNSIFNDDFTEEDLQSIDELEKQYYANKSNNHFTTPHSNDTYFSDRSDSSYMSDESSLLSDDIDQYQYRRPISKSQKVVNDIYNQYFTELEDNLDSLTTLDENRNLLNTNTTISNTIPSNNSTTSFTLSPNINKDNLLNFSINAGILPLSSNNYPIIDVDALPPLGSREDYPINVDALPSLGSRKDYPINVDALPFVRSLPKRRRKSRRLRKYAGGHINGNNGYDYDLNTNYREPLRLSEYLSDQMFDDQYNTEEYDDSYMSYGNAYDDSEATQEYKRGGAVDINNRNLPRLAELIEGYGRNGDTELAHINPIEAHILKSLGGSGTINPVTGLREYSFWKKPWKAIRSVIGGGAGALVGNMIAPGIGGIIGGALGQGAQHAARGKNVLQGALKGAGMGAALPSAASALGWGAGKIGATGIGLSLSNYGNTNAILPALGLGNSSFASNVASYSPYSVLSQGMGRGGGQGLGVSGGDYAENYYNYMLDRQKKQDNMGFTDKLQDYLTEPKNLLTLGTTAAQYAGRQKPKSPEKIAEEERRYRNASRKTIAEIEADEALETARSDLKKKKKNKRLEEDINNMGRVNRRVVSPEEFARTGRWFEYTDDVGNPVRMKGGGLMHSPYAYLMEERYYPRSSDGYLDGDTGGQDDLIDARLSDGEYVLDASTVSDLGDGNNSAGARKLDNFRRNIREHKRGGKVTLPPRAKSLENYLRG